MTRPLSRAAAKTVERLDLEQAFLVTLADLRNLMDELGVRSEPKLAAKRLRDHGWLLPTAFPGVWEFAPGAQAGPYPHGHPFREVITAHRAHPELDLAVGLTSALWAHGLTERSPVRPEVAVPPGARVPTGLTRACRIVRFQPQLPPGGRADPPGLPAPRRRTAVGSDPHGAEPRQRLVRATRSPEAPPRPPRRLATAVAADRFWAPRRTCSTPRAPSSHRPMEATHRPSSSHPLPCGARSADGDENESERAGHLDHESRVPIK